MATTVGALTLTPSYNNISVISSFSGDTQLTNQAILEYRQSGASDWMRGIDMTVDRRANLVLYGSGTIANPYRNQWRAVVFWLTPKTSYDIRVTYSDPNGVTGTNPAVGAVTTLDDDPPSSGNTYYVSTSGNDATGNGSQSNPWRTVTKAASMVSAGDTVRIMPGTYSGQVRLSRSGIASNYITFRSDDPSNKAIVTSSQSDWPVGTFNLAGVSYNRLKELDIRNSGGGLALDVFMSGNAIGNIVEDCILSQDAPDYWSGGVILRGGPRDTLIQRNLITTSIPSPGDGPYGVQITETEGGTVVRRNQIYGNFNNMIGGEPNFGVNGGLYFNSYVYENTLSGNGADGIEADGGGINCGIWSNSVTRVPGYSFAAISIAPVIVGPTYIFRNTVLSRDAEMVLKVGSSSYGYAYVYHNTFYVYSGFGQGIATYGSDSIAENIVFRNNIIRALDYAIEELSGGTGKMNFDYDCMYGGREIKWRNVVMTWTSWRSSYKQEAHGIWAEPGLVNPANGDFTPIAGSNVINKGVILPGFNDINSPWPYSGTAPDMGAIEVGTGPGVPVASFSASPTSGGAPLNVAFADSSTGAITSWLWDFGDGNSSNLQNPTHIYQAAGNYIAMLTVTGPGGSTSSSVTITVSTAPPTQYTLVISSSTGGTTNPAPGNYQYAVGQVVALTATPASGWLFDHWEGAVANPSLPNTTVTMNQNQAVVAVFIQIVQVTLNISVSGQGGTTPAPGQYTYVQGSVVTISASPSSGWVFNSWQESGVPISTQQQIDILLNTNRSLVAVFDQIVVPPEQHSLTISVVGDGSTSPAPGAYLYEDGAVLSVQATPGSGSRFVEWVEGTAHYAQNPIPITMSSDRSLVAVFELIVIPPVEYTLAIQANTGGHTVPAVGSYTYHEGDTVGVAAIPDAGYQLVEWRENGQTLSTEQAITVLMDSDRTVEAVFEQIVVPPEQYTLTISVIGNGTTEPAPGAYTYPQNQVVTITPRPLGGYKFNHWEGDVSGTDDPISFPVNNNMSVVAVFVAVPPPEADLLSFLWGWLPFFPWEGLPVPRFTAWTWEHIKEVI